MVEPLLRADRRGILSNVLAYGDDIAGQVMAKQEWGTIMLRQANCVETLLLSCRGEGRLDAHQDISWFDFGDWHRLYSQFSWP